MNSERVAKNRDLEKHSIMKNLHILGLFTRAIKSKFIRNVAVVASGSVVAQAITMAFSPLITRIYGPEAFGLLGVFLAVVAVLSPLAALSYPIAIILPRNDNDAKVLVKLSLCISITIALLTLIIMLMGGDFLLDHVGANTIPGIALLIPLVIVFSALIQVARQWLVRKQQFMEIATAEIAHSFTINIVKVGIGSFYPLAIVLIVLSILGKAIYAGIMALGIKRLQSSFQENTHKFEIDNSFGFIAKKYYDFPVYRTPQILINALSQNLPIIMLAASFGPASAGYYAICRRVLSMPTQLIGKSVRDVFYPRITEAAHQGENLTFLILKATGGLAALGIIPFSLIIAFGPWLFGFVFGSEWMVAGEYARWLSLMMFFLFINKPSVAAIPTLDLQSGLLVYEVASTASKILALYIGIIIFNDDIMAVFLFGSFGAVAYILLIIWVIISSTMLKYRKEKPK